MVVSSHSLPLLPHLHFSRMVFPGNTQGAFISTVLCVWCQLSLCVCVYFCHSASRKHNEREICVTSFLALEGERDLFLPVQMEVLEQPSLVYFLHTFARKDTPRALEKTFHQRRQKKGRDGKEKEGGGVKEGTIMYTELTNTHRRARKGRELVVYLEACLCWGDVSFPWRVCQPAASQSFTQQTWTGIQSAYGGGGQLPSVLLLPAPQWQAYTCAPPLSLTPLPSVPSAFCLSHPSLPSQLPSPFKLLPSFLSFPSSSAALINLCALPLHTRTGKCLHAETERAATFGLGGRGEQALALYIWVCEAEQEWEGPKLPKFHLLFPERHRGDVHSAGYVKKEKKLLGILLRLIPLT